MRVLAQYDINEAYQERLVIAVYEEIRLPSIGLLPKVRKLEAVPSPEKRT